MQSLRFEEETSKRGVVLLFLKEKENFIYNVSLTMYITWSCKWKCMIPEHFLENSFFIVLNEKARFTGFRKCTNYDINTRYS